MAGLAVTRLPATVARLRSAGEPISRQAWASGRARSTTAAEAMTWLCVTRQPRRRRSPSTSIRSRPGIRVRSTSTSTPGRTPRSSSTSRSVPPAMARAAGPYRSRAASAASSDARRLVATDPLARPLEVVHGSASLGRPGDRHAVVDHAAAADVPAHDLGRLLAAHVRAPPRCPGPAADRASRGACRPRRTRRRGRPRPGAPQTTRLTPAHGSAPMHMAHGSHDVTSSRGPPTRGRGVPRPAPARAMATISAWAIGARVASTRLTPAATTRPLVEGEERRRERAAARVGHRGLGQLEHERHAGVGRRAAVRGPRAGSWPSGAGRTRARSAPRSPCRQPSASSLTKRTGRATLGAMAPPPATALHADHARLAARLDALAEIGATGDGGCCRLALTDDDRAGTGPRRRLDAGPGPRRSPSTPSATWSGCGTVGEGAPVMTGSHIDTVRTGGRYDGNFGVLAGLEVVETLEAGRHRARPARWRSPSSPTRRAPASRPDMLGSPRLRGRHAARGGARPAGHRRRPPRRRAGAHRLRRAAALPEPDAGRLRRAAHRAGPGAGGRGHHDRRRHRGPGDLLAGADRHRPVQPRRHHADGPPPRRRLRRRRAGRRGAPDGAGHGRPPGRHGRPDATSTPTSSTWSPASARFTVDLRNTDEAALQEAERRLAARAEELAAAEGVTVDRDGPRPLRAGRVRPRVVDLVEAHGGAPRPLGAADAVGRRPRRPDAGPRLPDRDGLRAEPSAASATTRPSTPIRPTWPPAPTSCSTSLLDLADGHLDGGPAEVGP